MTTKRQELIDCVGDVQAIFTHNNGYDSIYVPDGSFLIVEPSTMKDFIDADPNNFSDWHGEEWWMDDHEHMMEAAKEGVNEIVAYYLDGKLVVVDEDLWEERKNFYLE